MHLLVTGTLAYDYIMDFRGKFADRIMPEKIHQLSLSFLVDKLNKQFGGTAVNIGYTLKLLGVDPLIVAPAGNDFELYKNKLHSLGITTKYIKEFSDVACGSYFGITDASHNQIGAFYAGAIVYAKDLTICHPKMDKKTFVVISPTDSVAMKKYVDECIENNFEYLFDPAFQIGDFSEKDLKKGITHARIFIGNDYEIALVEKKLKLTHKQLIQLVPILVTTLGAKGSLIETKGKKIEIMCAKVSSAADPTGAGDAYRAGFLAGFARNFDLMTCGQMGAVAAAYTVEKYGTQTHSFTIKEFCKRYLENFHAKITLS
jgi:adenosine kinase